LFPCLEFPQRLHDQRAGIWKTPSLHFFVHELLKLPRQGESHADSLPPVYSLSTAASLSPLRQNSAGSKFPLIHQLSTINFEIWTFNASVIHPLITPKRQTFE